jgi:hypothetical protein
MHARTSNRRIGPLAAASTMAILDGADAAPLRPVAIPVR